MSYLLKWPLPSATPSTKIPNTEAGDSDDDVENPFLVLDATRSSSMLELERGPRANRALSAVRLGCVAMVATIVLSAGVVIATRKATQEVEAAVGEVIDEVDPHQPLPPSGGGVGPAAAADAVAVADRADKEGSAYGEPLFGLFDDRGMDWIADYYYDAAAAEKEFEEEEKEGPYPLAWDDDWDKVVIPTGMPPLKPVEEEGGSGGKGEKGGEGEKEGEGKGKGKGKSKHRR